MKKLIFIGLIVLLGCEKDIDIIPVSKSVPELKSTPILIANDLYIGKTRTELISDFDTLYHCNDDQIMYIAIDSTGGHRIDIYLKNDTIIGFIYNSSILERNESINEEYLGKINQIYEYSISRGINFNPIIDVDLIMGEDYKLVEYDRYTENGSIYSICGYGNGKYRSCILMVCKEGLELTLN